LRVDASQASQPKSEEEENVALHVKSGSAGGSRDMSKVKCFACHNIGHYASQSTNKKKKEAQVAASASTEMDDFAKKFEEEFYLVTFLSSSSFAECGGIGAWIMDSGSSRHMTGVRSMFLRVLDIG
jgi:hypothetical protein